MPIVKIARFEIRPDQHEEVERAIAEFASYVGSELTDSSWVTFREKAHPNRYISVIRADDEEADERQKNADGTKRFVDVLYPRLVGDVEFIEYEQVASSEP